MINAEPDEINDYDLRKQAQIKDSRTMRERLDATRAVLESIAILASKSWKASDESEALEMIRVKAQAALDGKPQPLNRF